MRRVTVMTIPALMVASLSLGQSPAAPLSAYSDVELSHMCEASARYTPASAYCGRIVALMREGPGSDEEKTTLGHLVNINEDAATLRNAYAARLLNVAVGKAAFTIAGNLLKRQPSSPATTNGTTSLVAKTAQTTLLAAAIESGALTQSQNGNQITLQANLDHLFHEAFLGNPDLRYVPEGSPVLENMTASVGLAVNANSSLSIPTTGSATSEPINTTNVLTDTGATQLSSVNVNYEFNNPLSRKKIAQHRDEIAKVIDSDPQLRETERLAENKFAADFAGAVLGGTGCTESNFKDLKTAFLASAQTAKKLDESAFGQLVDKFNACFAAASKAAEGSNPAIPADLAAYTSALAADIKDYDAKLRTLSGWDLSAQYVFEKPVNQPETHDFRLIGSGNLSRSAGSVWTVNAAVSIYGNVPTGAQYGRFKDAQFSAQFDRKLGSQDSAPSFSVAGYGQYQDKPSVLNITSSSVPSDVTLPANAQVFLAGTQGWLGVAQVKLTLHLGNAQIPISGKWSNKTDLLDSKNKLGAQFGLSYDISQLKQLVGLGN